MPERQRNKALRAARVAAGLTQLELATRVGATQPAIAAYESGAKVPSCAMAEALAAALDEPRIEAIGYTRRPGPLVVEQIEAGHA